ncbi:MAG: helix-turn-helix transcriptional regulator [Treponema sp.]|nr:helix-turn-helix transcriptional regulator [Treponema sp.]
MKCLFWKQVHRELLNKGLGIKDLEYRTKIPYSTIVNAMNRNSMPKADTALKISKALNRSVEYLLGEKKDNAFYLSQSANVIESSLFRKYAHVLDALEKIPPDTRESLIEFILNLSEKENPVKEKQRYRIR